MEQFFSPLLTIVPKSQHTAMLWGSSSVTVSPLFYRQIKGWRRLQTHTWGSEQQNQMNPQHRLTATRAPARGWTRCQRRVCSPQGKSVGAKLQRERSSPVGGCPIVRPVLGPSANNVRSPQEGEHVGSAPSASHGGAEAEGTSAALLGGERGNGERRRGKGGCRQSAAA